LFRNVLIRLEQVSLLYDELVETEETYIQTKNTIRIAMKGGEYINE